MKIKTDELQGAALDWAVAKCEGREYDGTWVENFSSNWLLGGPIIEREKIQIWCAGPLWGAGHGKWKRFESGDTPLIAAMRCYVAGKLGSEIDIPEELK